MLIFLRYGNFSSKGISGKQAIQATAMRLVRLSTKTTHSTLT